MDAACLPEWVSRIFNRFLTLIFWSIRKIDLSLHYQKLNNKTDRNMIEINKIETKCQVTDYQIECIKEDVQNLTFPFCEYPVDVIIGESDLPFKNGLMVLVKNDEGYFGWQDSYQPVKLNYACVDGCGGVELGMTDEIANACYHSGSCDANVEYYLDDPIIREQLDKITDERLIKSLNECGIDEYNPSEHTRRENEAWALFLAAANYKEDKAAGYFDNED